MSKKKCLPCLLHQTDGNKLFMMSWSCRGEEPHHQLISAKNRIYALSKMFNKEEYDQYVTEMEESRKEDPDYGSTKTWKEWLESMVDEERWLTEFDTDDVVL